MMKRTLIALCALAAFLLAGCNDFLSEPPGSVSVSLDSAPTAMPGSVDCAISWVTNVDTKHILEYGTATGSYTVATPLSSSESAEHAVTLDSLLPGTTYYYRVRSYYRTYEEVDSEEYSFTTLKGPTSLAFTALPAATPSQTSASIAFTTNSATASTIEYGTASGVYDSSLVLDSSATAHARVISGLSTGMTYYYVVHCYSASSGSLVSSEYSFTTTTDPAPTSAQRARGIWLVGGCSGANWTSAISAIDLFDPVTATWYPAVTSLPTPVSFAAVGTGVYNGDRVLIVVGGFDAMGTVRNIVQRYDIETQTWLSNGSVLPAARANVVGATRNNCLYVVGGTTGNATAAWAAASTDYEYNIAGDSWALKVAIPAARSEAATAAFDDEIVYAGGRSGAAATTTLVDGILTVLGALTAYTEPALPTRSGLSLVLYTPSNGSSCLIALGGFSAFPGTPTCFALNNGGTTGGTLANTMQYLRYPFYNPTGTPLSWQNCASLPSAVAFGSAVIYGNILYYFGGTTSYTASGTGTVYTTDLTAVATATGAAANSWTTMATPMSTVRYGHAAVRFN
jgi:hypothetical protein